MLSTVWEAGHGIIHDQERKHHPAQWAGDRDVVPVGLLTNHNVDWYRAQGFGYLAANGRYRTHDNQLASAQKRMAATLVRSFDDRQLAARLEDVMMLLRTFVSRPNRAWARCSA